MSARWTEADLARAGLKIQENVRRCLEPVKPFQGRVDARSAKYKNVRTQWQGQGFDSKHELRKFQEFELERLSGRLRAVVRQVSFQLPGTKRRIRIDFMLVENDGRIRWVDAKGVETQAWQLKRDQVQQAFGLSIETV